MQNSSDVRSENRNACRPTKLLTFIRNNTSTNFVWTIRMYADNRRCPYFVSNLNTLMEQKCSSRITKFSISANARTEETHWNSAPKLASFKN